MNRLLARLLCDKLFGNSKCWESNLRWDRISSGTKRGANNTYSYWKWAPGPFKPLDLRLQFSQSDRPSSPLYRSAFGNKLQPRQNTSRIPYIFSSEVVSKELWKCNKKGGHSYFPITDWLASQGKDNKTLLFFYRDFFLKKKYVRILR